MPHSLPVCRIPFALFLHTLQMADVTCKGHPAGEVAHTSSHLCPSWLPRVSQCPYAQVPLWCFPLSTSGSGCRSASLGRSPNCWGDARPELVKGTGAVRVPMSRLDTAGSLGLCLSRPGLHIHQQLVVHAKLSRLQPALLLTELPDGRPCLQTHFPLSFECLFLTVSSLCKKLLSWSESVTLL